GADRQPARRDLPRVLGTVACGPAHAANRAVLYQARGLGTLPSLRPRRLDRAASRSQRGGVGRVSLTVEAYSADHPCPGMSGCTGLGSRALESLEISNVPVSAHNAHVQSGSRTKRAEIELVRIPAVPGGTDWRPGTYRATRPRGRLR